VSVPRTDDAGRAACAGIHQALPERVLDRERRDVSPDSDLAAAWGDPPIVLRCGVGPPAGLTPTSEVLEVEDVEWFLDDSGRVLRFTTVGRRVAVEVAVPPAVDRSAAAGALVDLAPAVQRAGRAE
jgi:hypothetical protein